jgi:hypothetical protein
LFKVRDLFNEVPGPLTESVLIDASTETTEDWLCLICLEKKEAPKKMTGLSNPVIWCIQVVFNV